MRGESFDEYELRRTELARDAAIAPLVTEREDAGDDLAVIGNAWSRAAFGGLFYVSQPPSGELPATNLVFVQSRDGNTVTHDPSTLGGGEADKHLIYEGLTRVAADAVLGGGRTVRRGHLVFSVWRPEIVALRAAMGLPRHPVQIAATLHRLRLDQGLMFNTPALRVILITVPRGADAMRGALRTRPWISLVVMDDPSELRGAFTALRRRGIERMSCVGGRMLAGELLDAGLVQDVYLTTGNQPGGEPGTPLHDGPLHGREVVRKRGTGADRNVLFQHIVIGT